jgi:hypothetical protein
MMASAPQMTRVDRAERHKRIAAAIGKGVGSRAVAEAFGMTDSHVRYIARIYGVAHKPGRQRK